MADVINLGDVSTKDTGAGSKLKTGNLKRSYNMPRECVEELVKKGWSRAKAHKYCYSGQKAGTSAKDEQNEVGTDRAKSDNVRMQKNLNKQASY
tara:strand:+ start:466 stop:747 length:282 start_codon:yes stop_codon:yes gene_type:complete